MEIFLIAFAFAMIVMAGLSGGRKVAKAETVKDLWAWTLNAKLTRWGN